MMTMITVLQIRYSGEDATVYLCKDERVAERIVREWFKGYDNLTLAELDEVLWEKDLGFFQISMQMIEE